MKRDRMTRAFEVAVLLLYAPKFFLWDLWREWDSL